MKGTEWADPVYIGVYGWRKRCLYVVLLFLVLVVTINITLVFWLMKVLQLNTNGMKYLQMVGSGVQFTGNTFVLDTLVTSGFFTRPGETISIQSAHNLTMRTTDHAGHPSTSIYLGNEKLEINSPLFKVTDPRGKTLFSVDKDMVSLTADLLSISGEGGAIFEGSLQTPIVSAAVRSDLKLESATKGVQTVTPAGVSIESRAGDILAASLGDISLVTVDGSIKFESGNVLIPNLRYPPQPSHRQHQRRHHPERIYQLCICESGELYLGEADSFCQPGANNELCR